MKEVKRWVEDDGAPAHLRALLHAAAPSRSLPESVQRRSARRVALLTSLPLGLGALLTTPGVLLAAGAGMGAGLIVATLGPTLIQPSVQPMPPASVAPSRQEPARPRTRAVVPPAITAAPTPEAPRAPTRVLDSLPRETELLERARATLGSDPALALSALREHATRFPRGKLSIERQLLEIDALGRSGQTAAARARLNALREPLRGSIYEPRLEQLSASLP
ncbi:MAG TPA: hypothetical protein VK524_08240 [Polyangiaceae bacterium]|nr:hypothetical protein [Polyangiaceae bacterium]